MTDLADKIEAAIAAQPWPTPSAVKRGQFDRWPYVSVLVYPHGTQNPIKGNAFETRDEAVAAAKLHLEALKNSLRERLADPRHRALRQQYGLPAEISGCPKCDETGVLPDKMGDGGRWAYCDCPRGSATRRLLRIPAGCEAA